MNINREYKKIINQVKICGFSYEDKRRGVQRTQIPSYTLRHELSYGFPLIGIKKTPIKTVITELLWFLRGDNKLKFLHENGCRIWDKDAENWKAKTGEIGSAGRNYSVQWRDYNGDTDQIVNLINNMIDNIMDTRLIVQAWNPSEINQTALPPCHTGFQIVGIPLIDGGFGFELHWHQRSVDLFLGLPFNIASYAALGLILEKITGYKCIAVQGDLKNVHLYENSYSSAAEIMKRGVELSIPKMTINKDIDINPLWDFEKLEVSDFIISNYSSYQKLSVEMLAPKEI